MKQKNWIFLGIAAGICIASVGILIGCMGTYAEKSGTEEWTGDILQQESGGSLTQILTESSKTETIQSSEQESELQETWQKLYTAYLESGFSDSDDVDLPDVGLTAEEAGLIFLKEIKRIYPEDTLDNLYLRTCQKEHEYDGENYLEWYMLLDNTEDPFQVNENEISYSIAINAVSSKIVLFGKYRPFKKGVDYACSSWTDDDIIEHVRQMIETYQLTDIDSLDWSDVEVFNGTDEYASALKELEEDPETNFQISSFVFFSKNGQRHFQVCIDWMTGELSDYVWLGGSVNSFRN